MKKLLLFSSFLFAMGAQAQDYWTEYATAQSAASTGMRSISIIDPSNAWLSMSCGTTGCTTIRRYAKTVTGGTSWTTGVVDLGAASANLEIANIHGVSATVAYASVFPKATGAIGGIYKTIDGGATWIRQATATYSDAASFADLVYFWNASEGVAVGDPANGYYEIYTTVNGGALWTRVASSPALIPLADDDYGLTNQFTTSGNSIWVGTTYGTILHSSDKGLTWSWSQSPITDFGGGINGDGTGDMAFTSESNGLLQTGDYLLYNTVDGGNTWTNVDWTGVLRNFGVAEIPGLPETYVSVGEDLDNTERGSSFSTDGGLTWTSINENPDTNYVDGSVISFLDSNTGFASGFSTSAAVGGIFKWNGNSLAVSSFSNEHMVSASPNPTTGELNIAGKNISQVVVFDILGKQVSSTNYSALNNVSVNLTNLTNGVYMVKVTNDMGTSAIKVVKK
jgi:hypothetical protein